MQGERTSLERLLERHHMARAVHRDHLGNGRAGELPPVDGGGRDGRVGTDDVQHGGDQLLQPAERVGGCGVGGPRLASGLAYAAHKGVDLLELGRCQGDAAGGERVGVRRKLP